MKIIVALDSFKDCLGSVEAGMAVGRGILAADPDAEVVLLPMADGGEGTMSVLQHYLGGETRTVSTHDALMRPVEGKILFVDGGAKAVIELAESAGIMRLAEGERRVMHTTSYGMGEMIRAAAACGATEIICTLGGSATNDAGIGAMQALGLQVFTDAGLCRNPVTGADLRLIRSFDRSGLRRICYECDFRFLYDANIDFTGPRGAVRMYARQKGATGEELILLEEGMNNVAVRMEIGAGVAGLGAAGGAGGGLYAFLGAEGVRGIDVVLDAACFDVHLHNADLVITGEGKADAQTSQGKVAKGVLSRAARTGVPVALLAGRIDDRMQLCSEGYGHIVDINENPDGGERTLDPLDPLVAADRLARAARRLVSSLKM